MKHLKTENCIICGSKAVSWHGHVIAKEKMALGNYIDKPVVAGFCDNHSEEYLNKDADDNGCYGNYDSDLMGRCIPLFNR